jgi:hypothetical protein
LCPDRMLAYGVVKGLACRITCCFVTGKKFQHARLVAESGVSVHSFLA